MSSVTHGAAALPFPSLTRKPHRPQGQGCFHAHILCLPWWPPLPPPWHLQGGDPPDRFLSGMDELMEVSFSPLAATGKPLSRCGKCHRFMKYIQVGGG